MRRAAILLAMTAGCETYHFGPEITPILVDEDEDPSCTPTEEEAKDGVDAGPCFVLRLFPYQLIIGEETLVEAAFDFRDPDADATKAYASVRAPSGITRSLECVIPAENEEVPCVLTLLSDFGARTLREQYGATVALTFFYEPEERGAHRVVVYMEDAEGLESNRLANTLEAAAPGQAE